MASILFFIALLCVIMILVLCATHIPILISYLESKFISNSMKLNGYDNLINSLSLLYHSLQVSLNPFTFIFISIQNLMIGITLLIHSIFEHPLGVLYYIELIMPYYIWAMLFISSALWLAHGTVKLYDIFDNATSISYPIILSVVIYSTMTTLSFLQYGVDILTSIFAVNVVILLYLTYKIANPPKSWKFK